MATRTPGCPHNSSLENGSQEEGWEADKGNRSVCAEISSYFSGLHQRKHYPPTSFPLSFGIFTLDTAQWGNVSKNGTLHRCKIINGSWSKPSFKVTQVKEMITWPVQPLANLCTAVLGFPRSSKLTRVNLSLFQPSYQEFGIFIALEGILF